MSKSIAKISLEEFAEEEYEYGGHKNSDYNWIEEKVIYSDLEKGCEDKEIILQRKSDNKYFNFKVTTSPNFSLEEPGLCNSDPLIGYEVFPKTKSITVYE